MRAHFRLLIVVIPFLAVLGCLEAVAQQRQKLPARPPTAVPTPSSSTAGSAANAVSGLKRAAGTVTGYIFWDMQRVTYNPSVPCQGLQVELSALNGTGMQSVASSSEFQYTRSARPGPGLGLCSYSFQQVPEEVTLQVQVHIGQPFASQVRATGPFGAAPIRISGGHCNTPPNGTAPSATPLESGWQGCGDHAYNVNFELTPGSTIGTLPAQNDIRLQQTPGANPSSGGMLKPGSGPAGMLSRSGGAPGIPANAGGTGGYTGGVKPGSSVQLNPQPLPPRQALTNAEVIRMLKSGIKESVIVHAIQTSDKRFDFSPAGCQALKQANVSAIIVVAMGDGRVRACPEITGGASPAAPGTKVELNPQPLPPRTATATTIADANTPAGTKSAPSKGAILKPVKLAPPTALRKVTNPLLAQQNAGIIAVLEQQRQVAQQDAAAMKAPVRAPVSVSAARAPVAATGFPENASASGLKPGQRQSAPGNISSAISHAPAFNSIVLTCTNDPAPRIVRVNAGLAPGIFTPEAKYNQYTIAGCSLGQSNPGNSAYIFGANGFKATLNVDFWSENGITAHLDPWLSGILDQENVTLVVSPAGQQQIQKTGFKFYAARGMPAPDGSPQEVQLAYGSMPQARVKLFDASPVRAGYGQVPQNGTSQFPSFSFQGTPVAGWVFRYAYAHGFEFTIGRGAECFINDVPFDHAPDYSSQPCAAYFQNWQAPAADVWDFSKLAPGFDISSYELYYANTDPAQLCGSWDDTSKKTGVLGNWDFNLTTPAQIKVNWALYWCSDNEASPGDRENEQKQSAYGLAVWVLGPRCVDPWTGQKDQSCMSKVKKVFGS